MTDHRTSYWKTSLPAGVAGVFVLVVSGVAGPAHGASRVLLLAVGCVPALPLLSIGLSGLTVLYRDAVVANRTRDLFHSLNDSRAEAAIAAGVTDFGLRLRQLFRTLLGLDFLLVGDTVEVRSFEEIRRTLDETDSLQSLPFMPEMIRFCGQQARVFRRVDKIYDYGGTKVVRRLKNTVLLNQMRCDGAAHGGCEAGCGVMWKEAWLKRATPKRPEVRAIADATTAVLHTQSTIDAGGAIAYRCQFTQLAAASTPLRPGDPRQDLRPLVSGNITVRAFLTAVLTRLFNYVQARRGGIAFPSMAPGPASSTTIVAQGLEAGEDVRVLPAEQICRTLDSKGRNRGLWFDRDMLKHCGRDYRVHKRVDHIIDDATGRMRTMKTPCIVLKDVNYSGEFLRFCAQEEHLYWREAWLSSARSKVMPTDTPTLAPRVD